MNRPLEKLWTLLLFLALPARSADEVRVGPFLGPNAPRVAKPLVPGAEIGQQRLLQNPIPLINPLGELSAILTVPELAVAPEITAAVAPVFGEKQAVGAHQDSVRAALGEKLQAVEKLGERDPSDLGAALEFGKLYSGQNDRGASVTIPNGDAGKALRKNSDGVYVTGLADEEDRERERIETTYKGKLDFSSTKDIMDDAYGEAYARSAVYENVSKGANSSEPGSVRIPMTLTWVDGVYVKGGKRVAVHTSRVFFHPAPNPQSEIKEGLRRIEHEIKDLEWIFKRNGKAEHRLGKFDQVALGFDTRGYKEIKDYVKSQEARLQKTYGNRFRFVYLDEVAKVPKTSPEIRAAVNDQILKHRNDGLLDVIQGVIRSRLIGENLERKTAMHYYDKGYKVLDKGQILYDENGMYITELDVIVRSPEGIAYLVEAKSARIPLTREYVMSGKILYKLDTYQKHRARIEKQVLDGSPLDVVLSVDVGVPPEEVAVEDREGYIEKQKQLMSFLRSQEKVLSAKYGFPVSFLFLYSVPNRGAVSPVEATPQTSSNGAAKASRDRRNRRR